MYDEAKRYLEALTMAYHSKKKLILKLLGFLILVGPNMKKDDGKGYTKFYKSND